MNLFESIFLISFGFLFAIMYPVLTELSKYLSRKIKNHDK